MDQKVIIEAIEKQMDSLESIFKWIILLTIPVFWAGLQRTAKVEALGMSFDLSQAFYILAVAYFFTTLRIYLGFRQIGDFLSLLDQKNSLAGISHLLVHKWAFNPFSYSGDKRINRVHNFYGFGGLISVWWVGNTALYTLLGFQLEFVPLLFLGLFGLAGLISMRAIYRVLFLIVKKLKQVENHFGKMYEATIRERRIGLFTGVAIGGLIYMVTNYVFRAFPLP